MKRLKGECYDCGSIIRCDAGGLASYHTPFGGYRECPGSREAVIPTSIVDADKDDGKASRVRRLELWDPHASRRLKPSKPRLEATSPTPEETPEPPPESQEQISEHAPESAPEQEPEWEPLPPPEEEPVEEPEEPAEAIVVEEPVGAAEEEEQPMPTIHAAFQGGRGQSADYAARNVATLDTMRGFFAQKKRWPTKLEIQVKLGVRPDTMRRTLLMLEEAKKIRYADGLYEVIGKVNSLDVSLMPLPKKPPKAPKPPESAELIVDDEGEEEAEEEAEEESPRKREDLKKVLEKSTSTWDADAQMEEDPLYKRLCEEEMTLCAQVNELRAELGPKEQKLQRLQRAIKAYVSSK